jgi:hypothetical protein
MSECVRDPATSSASCASRSNGLVLDIEEQRARPAVTSPSGSKRWGASSARLDVVADTGNCGMQGSGFSSPAGSCSWYGVMDTGGILALKEREVFETLENDL